MNKLILVLLFSVVILNAQTTQQGMKVFKKTGLPIDALLTEIDSVIYTNIGASGQPCAETPTVNYAGVTYNTVQIGNQCWLKENLNVGTMINSTSAADSQKNNGIIEKYCYNNIQNNCNIYGGLYQWAEAMQYVTTHGAQGICPSGWHIPTSTEFLPLMIFVDMNSNSLKALGQGGGAGTNASGFSCLLSGYRFSNGTFVNVNDYAQFWSTSELSVSTAYSMGMYGSVSDIYLYNSNRFYGFTVRCVKD